MIRKGVIISALGDSYKVALREDDSTGSASKKEYICKPRGVFRAKDITPYCGDNVLFDDIDDNTAVITEVLKRKNEIIRPPLANLDQIVFVISTCEPSPNILLLDKFLAVAEHKGIASVIVFTKTDKCPADEYADIYRGVYPVLCVDNTRTADNEGVDALKAILKDKFSAFTGNSGAGKSSLLNNICPGLNLQTNEISRKLGRGKHTTRRVDIYKLDCGGYIADTPGFSTFETSRYDMIMKDELADCFPDFAPYLGKCRFQDCSHTKEQGCAVIEAVKDGKVSKSRHDSYCKMYEEAKAIKPWEIKPRT